MTPPPALVRGTDRDNYREALVRLGDGLMRMAQEHERTGKWPALILDSPDAYKFLTVAIACEVVRSDALDRAEAEVARLLGLSRGAGEAGR